MTTSANKRYCFLVLIAALLIGCKHTEQPSDKTLASNVFNSGYSAFYGSYYDYLGIQENVVSMTLFSPNLTVDTAGYYVGTGTNLILSDIFLSPSDTLLPDGRYVASDSAAAFTFLRGQTFDDNPLGAYMLIITETGYSVEVLTEGSFELQTLGDSVLIDFNFKRTNGKTYAPTFRGVLPMYDARPQ